MEGLWGALVPRDAMIRSHCSPPRERGSAPRSGRGPCSRMARRVRALGEDRLGCNECEKGGDTTIPGAYQDGNLPDPVQGSTQEELQLQLAARGSNRSGHGEECSPLGDTRGEATGTSGEASIHPC